MVKNEEDLQKRKRRQLTPEQEWIRAFLEFYGTENITRFCEADLNGVALIRVVEALLCGDQISSEKCSGPGTICVFEHESDADQVEATVWFAAGEMMLEIKGTRKVKETDGEPDAA